MAQRILCLWLAFSTAAGFAQVADPDPARFAEDIARFAHWDSQNSPPAHPVLFVGSSSIVRWATAERFPELTVVNRGFGGSHISDVNHYIEQTVLKYAPEIIVFYAGNNDINSGKLPSQVVADYRRFVEAVQGRKPGTQILYVSIHPSPRRWALWPQMREVNERIEAYSATHPQLHFADISEPMLGEDGRPRPELFVEDELHLSPAGYDVWTPIVAHAVGRIRTGSLTRNPPPHVIFLMADDLGWGDVGYHGSPIQTPHIDGLARQGVRLNQFYVQPVCSPTRAALMTGRYPMRYGLQTGVVRPWAAHGLPIEERTLPQALRDAGYRTAIVGKWHLGHADPAYLPTRRGFDLQYGHYNGAIDYFTHRRDGGHDWHRNDRPSYDNGYATELLAAEAEQMLRGHDQSRPLFLYVPFNAPHTPLQAPQEYVDRYSSLPDKNRRIFAAMVTALDDAIGRIVSAVREAGFPPGRVLIFFCSDNGGLPQLGSNGDFRSGKSYLYEGGIRVPAVAVWEGVLQAGSVVDQPLHMVDMYPTLIGLAGGSLRQQLALDGRDAWSTIARGEASPHRDGYILHNLTPFHAAIRMGEWKLVRNGSVGANAVEGPERETWELFNIEQDPHEKVDLSGRHPEIVRRLRERLLQLQQDAAPPQISPNRAPAGFQVPAIWNPQSF